MREHSLVECMHPIPRDSMRILRISDHIDSASKTVDSEPPSMLPVQELPVLKLFKTDREWSSSFQSCNAHWCGFTVAACSERRVTRDRPGRTFRSPGRKDRRDV